MHRTVLVVGVGGVTNGGKSTLCHWLAGHVNHCGVTARIIHMDDYCYHDKHPNHVTIPEYNHQIINWDRPQAVDFHCLVADLKRLIQQHRAPSYELIREQGIQSDQLIKDLGTSDQLIQELGISSDDYDNVVYPLSDSVCVVRKENGMYVGAEENEVHLLQPSSISSMSSAEIEVGRDNIEERTLCNLCDAVNLDGIELMRSSEVCLIFVDGIMIYDSAELCNLLSLRYFFHLNYEEAKRRRSSRNYPGGEPPSYFERYAWPLYIDHLKRFGLDAKIDKDSSEFCNTVESNRGTDDSVDDKICDDTVTTGNPHVGNCSSGIPRIGNFCSEIPHVVNFSCGFPHEDSSCSGVPRVDNSCLTRVSDIVMSDRNTDNVILLNGSESLTRNCIKVLRDISMMLTDHKH